MKRHPDRSTIHDLRSSGKLSGRRCRTERGLYRQLAARLEALEPRTLLSAVIHVTNFLDIGPGSLRAAIDQANNTPGTDVIQFDKGEPSRSPPLWRSRTI